MENKDLIKELFGSESGVIIESDTVNKIVNESIMIDELSKRGSDINTFYKNMGMYIGRDGLFNNKPTLSCAPMECHKPDKVAILVLARESNDPDYEAYLKLLEAKQALFQRMMAKYGQTASATISNQINTLNNNDRVVTAFNKCIGHEDKPEMIGTLHSDAN